MASAPQPTLPLFYNDLMPLNSRDHANWKSKSLDAASWLVGQHAIPLTVDEFVQAQRDFPIVFSSGENPLPLALMGLNEGVNTFVEDDGKIDDPIYMPAYIRRYPFMLARLTQETDDLSLCFDPTADVDRRIRRRQVVVRRRRQGFGDDTTKSCSSAKRFEEAGAADQILRRRTEEARSADGRRNCDLAE